MSPASTTETAAWLRLLWGNNLPVAVRRAAALRWLASGRSLAELFTEPSELLARQLDLPFARIQQLLVSPIADDILLAALDQQLAIAWPIDHPTYPRRLVELAGYDPPLLLTLRGDPSALERPGLAIVGRRDADDAAHAYAHQLGSAVAGLGFNVLSGNAKGIDRAAHAGAAEAGGPTTGVLPHGILTEPDNDDLDLVLSSCHPRAPWRVVHALARNELIVALVEAVVVVQSKTTGGTRQAAEAALRLGRPLYVRPDAADSGGAELLRAGGQPLPEDPVAAAEVLAQYAGR